MHNHCAVLFTIIGALILGSCKSEENFPSIEDRVASPIDVATNTSGSHFYVLNSDFDRTYNQGSILVLDGEGNKVTAIEVPRMGRSITATGTDLLITTDRQDDSDEDPKAILFDITDPATPVLKQTWNLNCIPVNAIMRDGYPYFAVSCVGGNIWVGELKTPRESSTLKHVRSYGGTRRALHIDTVRGLLYGFYTRLGRQDGSGRTDIQLEDQLAFANTQVDQKIADAPNEVPDDFEKRRAVRNDLGRRRPYQFFVYDLTAGAAADFPLVSDFEDEAYTNELRWMYFNVANFDGTFDETTASTNTAFKHYRTNFWAAAPDPSDPGVFYLSHRNFPDDGGTYANHVIRVRLVGNPRATVDVGGVTQPAFTDTYFTFERVYGFAGIESDALYYPGDIEVVDVGGQNLLLVNHFRDLVHWARADTYFSIAAKVIDENYWVAETTDNKDPVTSYFQIAATSDGKILAGSFYGNAVILLDVDPGADITVLKRIE